MSGRQAERERGSNQFPRDSCISLSPPLQVSLSRNTRYHPRHVPRKVNALILTLCTVATFCTFLDRRDIVTSHEARVAQTARQMAASGWPWSSPGVRVPVVGLITENGDTRLGPLHNEGLMRVNPWLVPVINGNVRLQKPPLPYWCAALTYKLVGFNDSSARWFPAALGAVATLLIWDLARLVYGRRTAWLAALVWVSTQFVVDEFRKSMADPYLAFFTLACVWAWLRATRSVHHRSLAMVAFYGSLGFAFLAKGPVAFLTALPAVVLIRLLFHAPRVSSRTHVGGMIVFLALALPWPIYVMSHVKHALELWRYESIGEFTDNAEKARAWWVYLPATFQLTLPWLPMWLAGLATLFVHRARRGWHRSPRFRRRCFAIAWFAVLLAIFSISNVKKNAYLLPIMPAQTLIIADGLRVALSFARRTKIRGFAGIGLLIQAIIGIAFAAGLIATAARWPEHRAATVIASSVALFCALFTILPIVQRRAETWLRIQVVAYAAILVAFIGSYRAEIDNRRSPRPFALAVERFSIEHQLPIAREFLPEEMSIYLSLPVASGVSLPDSLDASAADKVLVPIDDNHLDIDRGLTTVDAAFLGQYLGHTPILEIHRVHFPDELLWPRWKLYEVTLDRRMSEAGGQIISIACNNSAKAE